MALNKTVVKIQNIDIIGFNKWEMYISTVDAIEYSTGYYFKSIIKMC